MARRSWIVPLFAYLFACTGSQAPARVQEAGIPADTDAASTPSADATTILDTAPTGGAMRTGGVVGEGGGRNGGTPSSGGMASTGGTITSGGAPRAGGLAITGGILATGGVPVTGGVPRTGGVPTTGGRPLIVDAATTPDTPLPVDAPALGGVPATGGTDAGGIVRTGGGTDPHRKFVGNITSQGKVDYKDLRFADYWDQITPENEGKWRSVQMNIGGPFNFATLDAIHDYARKNNLVFKESALIWGAGELPYVTADGVRAWIRAFCERYPDTEIIDVVNEPPPHTTPSFANLIGGNTNGDWKWIVNAFTWTHEACPNSILLLNDYNNIEYAKESEHFLSIVKTLQAAGAPIHGIGAEAHGTHKIPIATVKALMDNLHAQTGLPLYITEFDVGLASDDAQLAAYEPYFSLFRSTEYVHGITLWGWIMGATWIDSSGLVSQAGVFRPAMTWLMETLGRP